VARPRTALVTGIGVVALLLVGIWQVPQWLDWARYRSTIEALATATLGQPVTIGGPISLTLLPQPMLTAAQVNVGGSLPADLAIHVQALRLRIALLPLIGGHVDARELVLRGPDLHIPWPAGPGMLRQPPPPWLAAFAARIENGRLTIGQLAFTGIDGTLATLDTGALAVSGKARFSGEDWHFTARLTAAGSDGAAGLNVTFDGDGRANGLGASFTGQLAHDGALAGTIAGRAPNLAVLLPAPPVPFRAEGRLTVGNGVASVDDVALEIGGSPARGAMALRPAPNRRLDIRVAAGRLDLGAWLPVLMRGGSMVAGIGMPIGIDVSADAARFGGGTLEHVRAAFDLTGNDIVVRAADALLPGNGKLRLRGRLVRDDPTHPRFEGDARLEAPVLRTTARWLDEAVPGSLPARLLASLPDSVAQRAELTVHVLADGDEVRLQHLAGALDGVPVSGSLGFKRGEPPSLTIDLSLDRLALDPWMPPRVADLAELPRTTSALDAELRLNIGRATLAGETIDGLVVDGAIEAGSILLRRFEGRARGARLAASGMLGDGGKLSDGRISIETEEAASLADRLPSAWKPTPGLWHGPAKLDVRVAGPQEALTADVRLALADAQLHASPHIDLKSGVWSATLALQHPGARRLAATLGLPERLGLRALPAWLGDGSLSLVTHLSGGPGRLVADTFDLTAAALQASGDLIIDRSGAEPRLTSHVRSEALRLPLPNGGSDVPLPLGALHGWRGDIQLGIGELTVGTGAVVHDASVVLSVADDALRLDDFTAKLDSGTVTGSLAFDATADPPSLAVQAKVGNALVAGLLDSAPIDLLSGRADASAQLTASGYGPAAIMATLGGRGTLTVNDGTVSGFDLFRLKLSLERPDPKSAEAAASDALCSGATGFDRLELGASIAHGDLTLDSGSLTGVAGEAHVSGGMNLATRALDFRIALQPALPTPPEVAIRLTGPIDRPNRTLELAGLARWMAELVR
jgi:hypothetical protein